MAEPSGYRFEPLHRRGLLLGLGPSQVASIAIAVVAAAVAIGAEPGVTGFGIATALLAGAAVACRPVQGRLPAEWFLLGSGFLLRRRREVKAPPPVPALDLPSECFVEGVWVDQLGAFEGMGPVGVLLDTRRGTMSAVLRAKGGPFCLLDRVEKDRKLAAWAGALEALATQCNAVTQLQWCQRARPGDSRELAAHLHKKAVGPQAPGFDDHCSLIEAAGERAFSHDTLLVLSIGCPKKKGTRKRQIDAHASDQLRSEVKSFATQLRNAGFVCDGVLDAPALAAALAAYLGPGLDHYPRAHLWPLSTDEHWDSVRVDGYFHRTYWVAEWPRSRVGPDFLSSLLIGRGHRSFSVAMRPVPPTKAVRDAESSRTAQLADAQLRAQGGFIETAQHRRRAEAVENREVELADGRSAYTFSGYVSIAARGTSELDQACAELERAAGAAKICLRVLYGQQKEALGWALPLGRGV